MKKLHLITQQEQPYGTLKRCEVCGIMNQGIAKRWTNDPVAYDRSPAKCINFLTLSYGGNIKDDCNNRTRAT